MNGLGSFHRIGTVAVPKAPGQSGDRLGRADWAGDAATAKTKKPHVLGNGKRAPGHLPHSSEAKMHVPAYRTRVRGYQDATVLTSTATETPARLMTDSTYRYLTSCPRPAGNVHFIRSIQAH